MASADLNPQAPPFLSIPSDDIKAQITKDFIGLTTGDRTALENIVDLNLYLLSKVRSLESDSKDFTSQLSDAQIKIRELERELSYLNYDNNLLKQQIALTEDATRILFLRVEGLYEKNGENLVTYVASTLSRTGISCSVEDIDYVKRIGKFKHGSTRPVLVKFIREYKRNLILYNRANLNRNSNSLIWINDDVSDFTRRQRKAVRDIAAHAKNIGQTDLKVHGDGLVVGSGKYKHQDLDLLPPHLNLSTAKQPFDDSDLYFQSEYSPLSNFYPCPITDDSDGTYYTCAEQFFQHKKALFHEYTLTAEKIMKNRSPYELKRLGNQVTMNQEWKDKEEEVMTDILRAKFLQNTELSEILINTGSLHLHEASADHKWSTGAELASKALRDGSWPGLDRLGFLLENLRAELQGTSPSTTPDLPPHTDPNNPPPLEGDDLSPMPDDDGEEIVGTSPHPPSSQPPTLPPQSVSHTTHAESSVNDNPVPAVPASRNSPLQNDNTSPSRSPHPVPPLMQQATQTPSSRQYPLNPRLPNNRSSYPPLPYTATSCPSPHTPPSSPYQPNTAFGARFNSNQSRRKAQRYTSDRAPVRRSVRLSQSIPPSAPSH